MKLPFSFFLALRYLKPKRSFLSVISIITLLGVTIGIAVLVVVIAVMTGFRQELRDKILGHEPHLTVGERGGLVMDEEALRKRLDAEPGVEVSAPFVMAPVLLDRRGQIMAAKMRAVSPEAEDRLLGVRQFIKSGEYNLSGETCVMGIELAKSMDVKVGDFVTVHGSKNLQAVMGELQRAEEKDPNARTLGEIRELMQPLDLKVTGLFETGEFRFDAEVLLMPLYLGQELYGLEGAVHGVAVRTRDPFWAAEQFKFTLQEKLGPEFPVSSWIDMNQAFFRAVDFERVMMYFIVSLVVVVAGFSITNTLITITFQKKRDIGVLKALGASPSRIIRIFVSQGVVVGLLGNLCGFGLAAAIIYWRDAIKRFIEFLVGHEVFSKEIYQFSRIPAEVVPTDMLIIGGLSFGICVLAAMVPAWFAARLDPVRALREE